jgi:hypothetical protein
VGRRLRDIAFLDLSFLGGMKRSGEWGGEKVVVEDTTEDVCIQNELSEKSDGKRAIYHCI